MRNYMFDRDAGLEAAPAVPALRRAAPRRSGKRGIIVGALFMVVIIGLAVLAMVLRLREGSLLDHLQDALDGQIDGSYDSGDSGFGIRPGYFQENEVRETTIPRASAGVGALMSTTEERGRALSGPEIYSKVLPSIVSINAYSAASGSSGSGVVLSSDGYIITNYHVIEGMREAGVTLLTDGSTYRAKLVGYYTELDIAVLKIDAQGLTPAEFGSSRNLEVGETVYAIGNPMGYLYGSMTDGIVSAVNRPVTVSGHSMNLIQTSAALNSGNSGGALVNGCGQVVGITSAKIDPPSDVTTEALGLAIPINDVRRCVNTLLRIGEMENPAIGITCQNWSDGDGVLVVEVNEDSPARDAGLQEDDVILSANGIPVGTIDELKDVIYDLGVGAEMRCTVLRDGDELEIAFALYEV